MTILVRPIPKINNIDFTTDFIFLGFVKKYDFQFLKSMSVLRKQCQEPKFIVNVIPNSISVSKSILISTKMVFILKIKVL
jgi:hypothetical protein